MISYNNQRNYLLFGLFIAISLPLGQSESVKCYNCSNIDDPDCVDNPRSDKFIIDCASYFANKTDIYKASNQEFHCRKTVETGATFAGEKNLIRVIRSCGNIRNNERSCYRTADSQVKTETCECYDSLCNAANIRTSSSTFFKILIPALATILFNLS